MQGALPALSIETRKKAEQIGQGKRRKNASRTRRQRYCKTHINRSRTTLQARSAKASPVVVIELVMQFSTLFRTAASFSIPKLVCKDQGNIPKTTRIKDNESRLPRYPGYLSLITRRPTKRNTLCLQITIIILHEAATIPRKDVLESRYSWLCEVPIRPPRYRVKYTLSYHKSLAFF